MGIRPGRKAARLRPGGCFALRGARSSALGLLAAVAGLLAAGPARATTIDFEALASGTDAAAAPLPGVSVAGALVLDEATVGLLLGVPATGTWNTTPGGSHGALNTLAPQIELNFPVAVDSISVNVLALPDAAGLPGGVRLLAFAGDALVASDASDPAQLGDSGFPEQTLSLGGDGITRAILCSSDGASCLDPGEPSRFWIDDLSFQAIPEPSAGALAALGLAGLASARPRRLAASPGEAEPAARR